MMHTASVRAVARALRASSYIRATSTKTASPVPAVSPTFAADPVLPPDSPNHRTLLALDGNTIKPFVQPNAFVAPSASVIGSVVVNDHATVSYGAVVRGDLALIHVGAYAYVGENASLTAGSVDGALSPADAVASGLAIAPDLFVGDYSSIGPNACLSSCVLEGRNRIGAGAVVGPGARVGRGSVVAPNSVVGPDVEIPASEVWSGNPAVKVGAVSDDEITEVESTAIDMSATSDEHAFEFLPVGFNYLEKEALSRARA
jgi:carbonic anhydrase/acetyltransferase-like protein (isoleucine patch superfamily)